MRLCRECGTKIGEKDQFCTGCGAHIYRGEDCESYIFDEVEEELAPGLETGKGIKNRITLDSGKIKGTLSEMFGFVVDVYTRPAASSVKYGKKPIKEGAIILSLLLSMFVGILSLWVSKRASGGFKVDMLEAVNLGMSNSSFKIFAASFISFILLLFSMTFGLFAAGQLLYNVRVRFLALWNIATAAGVLYTTAVLTSIILSYLFPSLIIVIVIFIALIAVISIYQGIKDIMNLSEDHAGFTVGVGFVIMIVIIYLVGKI